MTPGGPPNGHDQRRAYDDVLAHMSHKRRKQRASSRRRGRRSVLASMFVVLGIGLGVLLIGTAVGGADQQHSEADAGDHEHRGQHGTSAAAARRRPLLAALVRDVREDVVVRLALVVAVRGAARRHPPTSADTPWKMPSIARRDSARSRSQADVFSAC